MLAPAGCEPYGHFFLFMNYKNKLSEGVKPHGRFFLSECYKNNYLCGCEASASRTDVFFLFDVKK